MSHYSVFLPSYSVGQDCYNEIPEVTRRLGRKSVVVGGKTAMEKAKESLLDGVKGSNVEILDFVWYGGNSTYENAEMVMKNEKVKEADMIFAVGGGRAVDTCKVVADKLDKPFFTFPTIASNCAACSAIAVMYNQDGTFKEYYYIKAPAVHTFINTKVVAEAPETYLWAGIGDALSKQTEVLLASSGKKLSHTPLIGRQLSYACDEPLLEFGKKALEDCKMNETSYELEQVALDIVMSTGLVSNLSSKPGMYYYNSSLAHAFYNGSTVVQEAEAHLHGEIVSFGVLCLLTYDKQFEKRKKLFEFNKSVNLPVCLDDLNIKKEDIPKIAARANGITEWSCVPYEVTEEKFVQAVLECDEAGQAYR